MKDWFKAILVGPLLAVLVVGICELSQKFGDERRAAERMEVLQERQTRALERVAGSLERLERQQRRRK